MKYIKNILLIGLLMVSTIHYSQTNKVKKADKKFDNLSYVDALEIYERVANNGFEDVDLFKRLGDGYYFKADYIDASKWYRKLAGLDTNLTPEYQFRYGQSLKAIGNYKEADILLNTFYSSQGIIYENSAKYLEYIEKNSNKYIVNTVDFNTENSDYPAYLVGDNLYVISGSKGQKKTPWNNEPTSDIFSFDGDALNNLGNTLNTKFNEGSLVVTKDGTTMYFTRNDYNGKKIGENSANTTLLKLYIATKIGGKWDNVKELSFNDSEYSVGHPALSQDERTLYFVSDMPGNGAKGGTDIYEVAILEDGSFGTPVNMVLFNTMGNEMFPFVANDNTFYFSSNGYIANLGGLDIYSSKANIEGVYAKAVNIGKPINSGMDDFAMMIDSKSKKGFFASNRSGTVSDDIYSLIAEPCLVVYKGVVRNKKTNEIIADALVSLVDEENNIISQKVAVAGLYEFEKIECNLATFVRAEKDDFETGEEVLSIPEDGISTTDVFLSEKAIDLAVGNDLGLLLNPIYFDLDKSNIRPDAEIELQKILVVMKKFPSLKIDIRSHTDSRAPDSYNMSLSERRAKSTLEYIIRGGIDRSRLTSKGYGETQLLNGCSNGIECYEGEHQLNRRSEFIIVSK